MDFDDGMQHCPRVYLTWRVLSAYDMWNQSQVLHLFYDRLVKSVSRGGVIHLEQIMKK